MVEFISDGTHEVASRITIGKTVTIIGNGTKTFITNNKNDKGVFEVTASGVAIYNSTFVNNSVSRYGGAVSVIYGGSGFTVTNSVFVNNSAGRGNAIYAGDSLTANDNWWGNNTPDWTSLFAGEVTHNTYAVLSLQLIMLHILISIKMELLMFLMRFLLVMLV